MVTMNFSDRCDTVHVFHSHQNCRWDSFTPSPSCLSYVVRRISDPFCFSFQIFHPFHFSLFLPLFRLFDFNVFQHDKVARRISLSLLEITRHQNESFEIHDANTEGFKLQQPLINNRTSRRILSLCFSFLLANKLLSRINNDCAVDYF